ncbi:hypothetical protein [Pseudoxanthomonas japonensis]|uniref:hypothetical protein n=1 Tax=Pseudoxanthomonas japonensis TaxID=69284 RepID=UPI001BCE33AA|nr:hypothetical protein [Pseudoxanthomonas japonensis]
MWAKSLAAALLGLPLTVGVIGLIVLVWPGELERITLPWLLLAFPLWVGVMSLAFLARSGWRAWAWMGGGTLLCFALIQGAKWMGWAAELQV